MSDEFVRYIVRCTQNFTDGNCEPATAKRGDVLDLNCDQWHKIKKSSPLSFELIDLRVPNPKKKEEPIEDTVDWQPEPWYKAQLARGQSDES